MSAEVISAPALVVSGGDDRALSERWSDSLTGTYPDYRQTGREELTATNRLGPYVGITTSFSASISGSRVAGRTFVRVWSADGAALSVTQVCQQGAFDEAAWDAVLRGVAVGGLSGQSRRPTRAPGSETPADSASLRSLAMATALVASVAASTTAALRTRTGPRGLNAMTQPPRPSPPR